MDILLSTHHPLDSDADAPTVTVRLAEALRKRGHSVSTLSYENLPWLPRKLRPLAFPWLVFVHVLGCPEYDVLDLSSGDGWVINLARRVLGGRRRQLSVARSHGLEHVAHERLVCGEEGAQRGNERGRQPPGKRMSWKYRLYQGGYRLWECRRSFELADVSLLLNEVERRYVTTRFGIAPNRIVKIGNGIDDSFARIARHLIADATTLHGASMNVAFIGPATFADGFTVLSKAMTGVLARYPQMKLGLFGTGGTEGRVLAAFPAELRKQIVVVTHCDHNDLPPLLTGFQIFAFASSSEPFGVVPLEAMACGLVPVVAETPGVTEYVRDGENGVVVRAGDADEFGTAITSLIGDRDRWAALRRAALATAVRYSWSDLAARVELLYCQHRQQRLHSGASPRGLREH